MSSVVQLDLFNQQPQLMGHETFRSDQGAIKTVGSEQVLGDQDGFCLRNEAGEVLMSLPLSRSRLASDRMRSRLLLEQAFMENRALSGLQLAGVKLQQVQLAGLNRMDIVHANFSKSSFCGCRLWVNLSGSLLTDLVATEADWHGSRLADCQLTNARLNGSNFQSVSFRRSNLSNAHLADCRLQMSDLSHCQLRHANLKGSDLSGCDLRHSDLSACDLRGVNLRGASLSVSVLEKANLKPIRQRIQHLAHTYPSLIPIWLNALVGGDWQAGDFKNLSDFLSAGLGYRVGAGWQSYYGSTEWIIWQFLRSIQQGEKVTYPLPHLLHQWLLSSK